MLLAGLRVILVACSLALDVFAVSVGVGMRGISIAGRVRIGLAFATAEVAMNLIGAGLGKVTGDLLGDSAGYLGFVALVAVGAYMLWEERSERTERLDLSRGFGLFIASLSISLDSLGVGFSIVYLGVPVPITLGAIAFASLLSTTLGLAFGARIGARAENLAGIVGGIALILTGLLFAALKFFHVG